MASELVIKAQRGQCEPFRLVPGAKVPRFSLGTRGNVKITAKGVQEHHVFMFFDGQQLWAKAVGPAIVAFVNNTALKLEWARVPVNATIKLGDATLTVTAESDDTTRDIPLPKSDAAPEEIAADDDETRVGQLPVLPPAPPASLRRSNPGNLPPPPRPSKPGPPPSKRPVSIDDEPTGFISASNPGAPVPKIAPEDDLAATRMFSGSLDQGDLARSMAVDPSSPTGDNDFAQTVAVDPSGLDPRANLNFGRINERPRSVQGSGPPSPRPLVPPSIATPSSANKPIPNPGMDFAQTMAFDPPSQMPGAPIALPTGLPGFQVPQPSRPQFAAMPPSNPQPPMQPAPMPMMSPPATPLMTPPVGPPPLVGPPSSPFGTSPGYGPGPQSQGAPALARSSLPTMARQSGSKPAGNSLVAQWNELSMPKKISLVLLPIAFFFVLYGLSDNSASNAGTAPSTSTKSSVSSTAKPAVSKAEAPTTPPPPPRPAATNPPATTAAAPDTSPPPPPPPPPPPTPSKTPARPTTSAASSAFSDQRRAVDQLAVGQYPSAAAIYRDLAQKNPRNKAFQEAARILSEHAPAQ